jgi:hypothetical protein
MVWFVPLSTTQNQANEMIAAALTLQAPTALQISGYMPITTAHWPDEITAERSL